MQFDEEVKYVYDLNKKKKMLQSSIDEYQSLIDGLKAQLSPIEKEISEKSQELLSYMKAGNLTEHRVDEAICTLMSRQNTGYTDELAVINELEKLGYTACVNIKKSLAKKVLNKELKTNTQLVEALSPYINNTKTEYVVVTNEYSLNLMREHMKEHADNSKKTSQNK